MNGKWFRAAMLALSAAIGGLVYASVQTAHDSRSSETGFICPLTGEQLPCPKCCPLTESGN